MATQIGTPAYGAAANGNGAGIDLSAIPTGNWFMALAIHSTSAGAGFTQIGSGATAAHIFYSHVLDDVPPQPSFSTQNYAWAVWENVGDFDITANQAGSSSLWIAPLPTGTAPEIVHANEDRWIFFLAGDGSGTPRNLTYTKRFSINSADFAGIWDQNGNNSASSPTDQYLVTPPASDQFSGAQVALYFEEFIPIPPESFMGRPIAWGGLQLG